jgi:hypothetical protein
MAVCLIAKTCAEPWAGIKLTYLVVTAHFVHKRLVREGRDEMVICPIGMEVFIAHMRLFLEVK